MQDTSLLSLLGRLPTMQSRAGGLAERLAGEIAGRRYQGFANATRLPRP